MPEGCARLAVDDVWLPLDGVWLALDVVFGSCRVWFAGAGFAGAGFAGAEFAVGFAAPFGPFLALTNERVICPPSNAMSLSFFFLSAAAFCLRKYHRRIAPPQRKIATAMITLKAVNQSERKNSTTNVSSRSWWFNPESS